MASDIPGFLTVDCLHPGYRWLATRSLAIPYGMIMSLQNSEVGERLRESHDGIRVCSDAAGSTMRELLVLAMLADGKT